MDKKSKLRTIEYKGHTINQELTYEKNPHDGDGYVVRTYIHEYPNYSDYDQLVWLGKDKQKQRIIDAEKKAKYHIDTKIKEKEPTIFDELGFK